jgi:hypothetical protein
MRLLFYHSRPDWSGTARAFASAADAMSERGYQVTYVCPQGSALERRLAFDRYTVLPMPMDGTWLTETVRLRQVILEQFVEVVFVHTEREQLIAAAAARWAERGAVVRRVPAGARLTRGGVGRFAERFSATGYLFTGDTAIPLFSPGKGALEPVSSEVGVSVEAHETVRPLAPAGLGTAGGAERLIVCVYEPRARRRAASVFRTVGMLAPRHPGLRLAVVGPGSDDEDLRMHAAALGITGMVAHLGERDDQLSVLRSADLAWVVAGNDDGAYGFLDPMAMRVPVLAERGSLSQRYVADGITGVLLPPGDPTTTAAKLTALLSNDERRAAMGNAGRARVARDFTERAMADAFEQATRVARDRTRWRS